MNYKELINKMRGTHDLPELPVWGPYTKRYMGTSHIPLLEKGFRFDFSAAPGLHRRKVEIPCIGWDTGYYPIAASSDLKYYAHRHNVAGDGKAFCDVEFFNLGNDASCFNCTLVNKQDWAENFSLNYFLNMNFPQMRDYNTSPVLPSKLILPESSLWIGGMSYSKIRFAKPYKLEKLAPDGRPHGQTREHGFTGGEGCALGIHDGDQVSYTIDASRVPEKASLIMRYKLNGRCKIRLSGITEASFEIEGKDSFEVINLGRIKAGKLLDICKESGSIIKLDGFAIIPEGKESELEFQSVKWNSVPSIERISSNSAIIKYADLDISYGIYWKTEGFQSLLREYFTQDLDITVRRALNNLISEKIQGEGEGHFTSVVMSPVFVKENSEKSFSGILCAGSRESILKRFMEFESGSYENICSELKKSKLELSGTEAGDKYKYSQNYMASLLNTQIVYPVNTTGTMIRHSPPGRWWDCLYTWDSGFIGLGLAELDIERAIWNLNAYITTGQDSEYAAFIHHGTPLPVQHYIYLEIWNRTHSLELLEYFYDPLERYYLFLAGRFGNSSTRNLKSGLVRTWDYFYNSGGWDDYPTQEYIHHMKYEAVVTPVVSTAHLIRVAKIMKLAAEKLGRDTKIYDTDIASLSSALMKYSWDEKAGYFGYVMHDENGYPKEILRHESGANHNMGMDGIAPLVSDICDQAQTEQMFSNMMSPGKMWSDVGISTVDQTAPYYKTGGYWNGAVWMPHQWFYWKAALNCGKADEAFKIASTALDVWERETRRTNSAFEHFAVSSGRGTGWHHFTGLSCPVINWYAAYFRPGSFTGGFDLVTDKLEFNHDKTSLKAEINNAGSMASTLIAVMHPGSKYKASMNGNPAELKERLDGVLELKIPAGAKSLDLKIERN